jgi:hypothetical protein
LTGPLAEDLPSDATFFQVVEEQLAARDRNRVIGEPLVVPAERRHVDRRLDRVRDADA